MSNHRLNGIFLIRFRSLLITFNQLGVKIEKKIHIFASHKIAEGFSEIQPFTVTMSHSDHYFETLNILNNFPET